MSEFKIGDWVRHKKGLSTGRDPKRIIAINYNESNDETVYQYRYIDGRVHQDYAERLELTEFSINEKLLKEALGVE